MLFCTENNLDPNDMVLSKNNQLFRDELQDWKFLSIDLLKSYVPREMQQLIPSKFLTKTLAAAGIKNGDMLMAVHADMLQYNSAGSSNGGSRSRTSSTTGQPDFDASARQLIQSCRNDRQKRNQE